VWYVNDADNAGVELAPQDQGRDADTQLERGRRGEPPDLLLDVSELRVDEISLEVDDLRARVALQADVLELLKLHVGVEAELGRVQLTIKGVEAEVLLKTRLDNVARIVDRVLTTIDNNPEIVEQLARRVGETAEQVGAGAGEAVGDLGARAGSAAEDVGRAAGEAVDDVVEETDEPRQRPLERRRRRKTETPKKRSARSSRGTRTRRSEEG
jgi:hypothetical protein